MDQWNKNAVPKCEDKNCSDEVLVTVEHIGYDKKLYRRVVKAVYFPYHQCTLEDMGWSMCDGIPSNWEYSEEDDSYWIPQGWYEICDYFVDYSYSAITDKAIAWMKLPKPCEPWFRGLKSGENDDIEKQKIERFNQIVDIVNCHLVAGKNNYKEKSECFDDISKIILDSYEHKQLNNANKIRSMSDEELSEFLVRFKNTFGEEYEGEQSCLDWLQTEAE